MYQMNFVMHLKIIKVNQQMYINKWILTNFQTFYLTDCSLKLKEQDMKILLKISLEESFQIKLYVKGVHISLKLNSHFYQ
jgi:hypothetical protein